MLREGRLAEARRNKMKAALQKQEEALLNVGREQQQLQHHHNQSDDNEEMNEKKEPLWKRLQDSDRQAKENRERLKSYLEHQYPFKPSINHVSSATASMLHHQQQQQNNEDHEQEHDREETENVVTRLYDESLKTRTERARERLEEAAKMQSRQYTFQPRVSLKSAQLAVRRAASLGGGTFAQRQQHSEACRQEHIQVMREAMKIKEEKERMQSKFGGYGRYMDPSEMSSHLNRMTASAQQKELKLKELAERSTAAECPFQPTTTKRSAEIVAQKFTTATRSSSPDVVKRMEYERQVMSARRSARQRSSGGAGEHDTSMSTTTATSANHVITPSRLQEFLEAQDEHVRRKEAKVQEMKHQLAYDEVAGCTFRPDTNNHHHHHHHHNNNNINSSNMTETSSNYSAARNTTATGTVDMHVRGMESVRARVALAAKLKQEQAEREAKAFGLKNNTIASSQAAQILNISRNASATRKRSSSVASNNSSAVASYQKTNTNSNNANQSVPRCAVSHQDYYHSASASYQRKRDQTQENEAPVVSTVAINLTRNASSSSSKVVVTSPTTQSALQQKRQEQKQQKLLAAEKRRQQQQQADEQKDTNNEDDLEEVEYEKVVSKKKSIPHEKTAAGLLPQYLLDDYEREWLTAQQQHQHQHHQKMVPGVSSPVAAPTTSTPRMSLKKKHQNVHYVPDESTNGTTPAGALGLALKKHLKTDAVRHAQQK